MDVQKRLLELADPGYREFQSKLIPNIEKETIMGIRTPVLRKFAKEYRKEPEAEVFLKALPHDYYDENMLHGFLISEWKEYETCVQALDDFLPYVDNWAVCDGISPKVFAKHHEELLPKIQEWAASEHVYTSRFGIRMLMAHFLDEDFRPEYLEIPATVHGEEYYLNMMIAWFFATALAKQWEATIPYLEKARLSGWVHNKTIQKARESYRITQEQKEYLKNLKRK